MTQMKTQLPTRQMNRHELPPQVHSPPVHPSTFIPSHVFPQPPQLLSSRCVSTQLPEQHCCEPEHTRPQEPQFATVSVRTQLPPQQLSLPLHARALAPVPQRHSLPMHVVPAGQLTVQLVAHIPPVQVRPAPQAFPHRPQFDAFVFVSTQPPPQHVCVPVHAAPAPQWQLPPEHVSPSSHAGVQLGAPASHAASGRTFASGTGPVSRGNGASKPTTNASGVDTGRPASRPPPPPLAQAPRTIKLHRNGVASDGRMETSTKTGTQRLASAGCRDQGSTTT